jgi:hypothetical protein
MTTALLVVEGAPQRAGLAIQVSTLHALMGRWPDPCDIELSIGATSLRAYKSEISVSRIIRSSIISISVGPQRRRVARAERMIWAVQQQRG